MTTYPDDADGAVLQDLAARGVDMTQPLLIEFPIAVPDEASAKSIVDALSNEGFESTIEYDEGEPDFDPATDDPEEFGPAWTVYVTIQMIPEYEQIVRLQTEFDRIAQPFGGKSDGWGVMLGGEAEG